MSRYICERENWSPLGRPQWTRDARRGCATVSGAKRSRPWGPDRLRIVDVTVGAVVAESPALAYWPHMGRRVWVDVAAVPDDSDPGEADGDAESALASAYGPEDDGGGRL